MSEQSNDAIAELKQLCQVLAADHVTVADVTRRLGAVDEDPGDGSVAVRPASPAFTDARIVRDVGSDAPAHVELTLRPSAGPTVADLRSAFGEGRELPRLHAGDLTRQIFYVDYPSGTHTCAIDRKSVV